MTVLIIAGVVILIAVVFLLRSGSRSSGDIQERLEAYSARAEQVTLEDLELAQPFSERVIQPMIERVAQYATRFTPQKTLEQTRQKLELAGRPNDLTADKFLAIRAMAGGGLGILFFLLMAIGGQPFTKQLMFAGGIGLFGFLFPGIWLGSKISARQKAVIKALPDALDLLTICVEAGLGFDAAMNKVNEKWDDPLSQEFGRVIQEIQLGKARRDALRDMSGRVDVPDVTSFVAAIIQTEQLGVSIAKVLTIQSKQMRMKRRQRAEEKAHQAPIKMLFPMVFLIFPAIYIVLLGPAALTVMNSGALGAMSGG
jgi:tight adherence protein C